MLGTAGDAGFEPSPNTLERAKYMKKYIEEKYEKTVVIEKLIKEKMDKLINKMVDDGLSPDEQLKIKEKLQQEKKKIYRESRLKYTPSDFEYIAIIGRGAFGEVRLCRWKKTGEIVAMKKLKKTEMIKKNQEKHIRAERDFLAKSNNPWIYWKSKKIVG